MFGARKWRDLSSIVVIGCVFTLFVGSCKSHSGPSPPELYHQARLSLQTGNLQQALTLADEGLSRTSSDVSSNWRFRLLKAEAVMLLGDTQSSLKLLGGDPPEDTGLLARLKMIQANDERRLGDNKRAEDLFKQSYELAKATHDPGLLAQVDLYVAGFHLRQEKFQQAEQDLRESLEAAGEAKDPYIAADAMDNLGVLKQNQLNFEEALYWFERVKTQVAQLGARTSFAAVLGNHGLCLEYLGNTDAALRELIEASQEAARVGIPEWQMDWEQNIGNILLERGDYDGAFAHYRKALDLARPQKNAGQEFDALTNMAELSLKRGAWDAAARYKNEAQGLLSQVPDPDAKVEINYLDGRVLAGRGDAAGAEAVLASVVQSNSNDPHLVLEAHTALADLYERERKVQRADAEYRAAIHYMDTSSTQLKVQDYQLTYLDKVNKFYRAYVDFLIRNNQPEAALETADASRARLLTGGMGVSGAMHNAKEFAKAARNSQATFLCYWLAPGRSYLWVVHAQGTHLIPIDGEEELRSLVEHYSTFIQDQGDPLSTEDRAGRELFSKLVAPAKSFIAPGSKVVVVPDGALHALNFETLPAGEDRPHYWIEESTVSVSPSLAYLLGHSAKRAHGDDSLLMIGDPVSPGQDFPRLSFAAGEIASIAKVFPADKEKILAGNAAPPSSYRASDPDRYSLIHFVAHSLPDKEVPLNSALILSPRNGVYKLSAREIAAVPLTARLVTLSACKGAGIRTYSGEGSVGLAWAFLHAGARSVVASLWDVDDASTSTLMAEFYSRVKAGMSPADALHAVKLERIRGQSVYRKPYYWGVFQMYSGGSS